MKEEDIRKQFAMDPSFFAQDVIIRKTMDLLKAEAKPGIQSEKKPAAKKTVRKEAETETKTDAKAETGTAKGAKPAAKAKSKTKE